MKREIYLKIIHAILGLLILYSTSFSQESSGGIPISWQDTLILSHLKNNPHKIILPNLNN